MYSYITKYIYFIFTILILILWSLYNGFLYFSSGFDPNYLRIDSCLDRGGCWDGIDKACRKNEENAQELCFRYDKIRQKCIDKGECWNDYSGICLGDISKISDPLRSCAKEKMFDQILFEKFF